MSLHTTPPPRARRRRRSRSIVATLGLTGLPPEEIAPIIALHVVQRAEQGPRRGRDATSARKALRKILERAPLTWLSAQERLQLLGSCLQCLELEVRARRLLEERRPLAWVAAYEGVEEAQLRDALRDPAVRRHYAWPEYSPVTGEIRFSAARFDHSAQTRMVIPECEPAGRVLAPEWRR